jgi:hypothetical protein
MECCGRPWQSPQHVVFLRGDEKRGVQRRMRRGPRAFVLAWWWLRGVLREIQIRYSSVITLSGGVWRCSSTLRRVPHGGDFFGVVQSEFLSEKLLIRSCWLLQAINKLEHDCPLFLLSSVVRSVLDCPDLPWCPHVVTVVRRYQCGSVEACAAICRGARMVPGNISRSKQRREA